MSCSVQAAAGSAIKGIVLALSLIMAMPWAGAQTPAQVYDLAKSQSAPLLDTLKSFPHRRRPSTRNSKEPSSAGWSMPFDAEQARKRSC